MTRFLVRNVAQEQRRPFLAFFADMLTFGIAMSFMSRSTVLPSLVQRLTGSAPLVGLVETVCNGAWLLPQLAAARFLATRSARKGYVVWPVTVQRTLFLVTGPMLLLVAGSSPLLATLLLFVILAVFYAMDAFASVAWFDLLSLSLPPAPRARMIGLSQLASGVAGIGGGWVVGRILGSASIPFPGNYALLFGLAGVSLLCGVVAIFMIPERKGQAVATPAPMATFLRDLLRLVRTDRQFALVVTVRLLVGASGMAAPFYILYALGELGGGQGSIGFFTAAQVVGGIASSLVMSSLSQRRGTRAVIRLCAALALSSPLVALATFALRGALGAAGLQWLYAAVFVGLGALANGSMAGFMSYLLEFAPPESRTIYVGLANTLNGVVLVMPFLGGWLLEASSFPVLFAVTAAVSCLGFLGSLSVTEPRHRGAAAVSP
jgi:MFS family permease